MDDIARAHKAYSKDRNATQEDVPLIFLGVGTKFIYEMTRTDVQDDQHDS